MATNWLETILSYAKAKDASIGAAQVKYGMHFGDPNAKFKDYGKQVGIETPFDLTDYTKSVLAAIALLSSLYKKAIEAGYDTDKPGVANVKMVSTGNAALDIAIVGYNMGGTVVTQYCGVGNVKEKCSKLKEMPVGIEAPVQKNYIPNYRGKTTSTGYVSEVALSMQKYKSIYALI